MCIYSSSKSLLKWTIFRKAFPGSLDYPRAPLFYALIAASTYCHFDIDNERIHDSFQFLHRSHFASSVLSIHLQHISLHNNDYLLPSLVLSKKELLTLPLSTYVFYGTYSANYGTVMAALVLTIAPLLIMYLFLQNQIISGVVAGAVKS